MKEEETKKIIEEESKRTKLMEEKIKLLLEKVKREHELQIQNLMEQMEQEKIKFCSKISRR